MRIVATGKKGGSVGLRAAFQHRGQLLQQRLLSPSRRRPATRRRAPSASPLVVSSLALFICVVGTPNELRNPPRSAAAAAGDARGGAQRRSAAAVTVKRAGVVYERLDRPLPVQDFTLRGGGCETAGTAQLDH